MIKAERVKNIIKILDRIYPNPPIPLDHKNIFELLISVLLSAQCTDVRVNQVTPSLFQLANNAKDMSRIDLNVIFGVQILNNQLGILIHILYNQAFQNRYYMFQYQDLNVLQHWRYLLQMKVHLINYSRY